MAVRLRSKSRGCALSPRPIDCTPTLSVTYSAAASAVAACVMPLFLNLHVRLTRISWKKKQSQMMNFSSRNGPAPVRSIVARCSCPVSSRQSINWLKSETLRRSNMSRSRSLVPWTADVMYSWCLPAGCHKKNNSVCTTCIRCRKTNSSLTVSGWHLP